MNNNNSKFGKYLPSGYLNVSRIIIIDINEIINTRKYLKTLTKEKLFFLLYFTIAVSLVLIILSIFFCNSFLSVISCVLVFSKWEVWLISMATFCSSNLKNQIWY